MVHKCVLPVHRNSVGAADLVADSDREAMVATVALDSIQEDMVDILAVDTVDIQAVVSVDIQAVSAMQVASEEAPHNLRHPHSHSISTVR